MKNLKIILKVNLILLVISSVNCNHCAYSKTRQLGRCVTVENCLTVINDINKIITLQTCYKKDNIAYICCPLENLNRPKVEEDSAKKKIKPSENNQSIENPTKLEPKTEKTKDNTTEKDSSARVNSTNFETSTNFDQNSADIQEATIQNREKDVPTEDPMIKSSASNVKNEETSAKTKEDSPNSEQNSATDKSVSVEEESIDNIEDLNAKSDVSSATVEDTTNSEQNSATSTTSASIEEESIDNNDDSSAKSDVSSATVEKTSEDTTNSEQNSATEKTSVSVEEEIINNNEDSRAKSDVSSATVEETSAKTDEDNTAAITEEVSLQSGENYSTTEEPSVKNDATSVEEQNRSSGEDDASSAKIDLSSAKEQNSVNEQRKGKSLQDVVKIEVTSIKYGVDSVTLEQNSATEQTSVDLQPNGTPEEHTSVKDIEDSTMLDISNVEADSAKPEETSVQNGDDSAKIENNSEQSSVDMQESMISDPKIEQSPVIDENATTLEQNSAHELNEANIEQESIVSEENEAIVEQISATMEQTSPKNDIDTMTLEQNSAHELNEANIEQESIVSEENEAIVEQTSATMEQTSPKNDIDTMTLEQNNANEENGTNSQQQSSISEQEGALTKFDSSELGQNSATEPNSANVDQSSTSLQQNDPIEQASTNFEQNSASTEDDTETSANEQKIEANGTNDLVTNSKTEVTEKIEETTSTMIEVPVTDLVVQMIQQASQVNPQNSELSTETNEAKIDPQNSTDGISYSFSSSSSSSSVKIEIGKPKQEIRPTDNEDPIASTIATTVQNESTEKEDKSQKEESLDKEIPNVTTPNILDTEKSDEEIDTRYASDTAEKEIGENTTPVAQNEDNSSDNENDISDTIDDDTIGGRQQNLEETIFSQKVLEPLETIEETTEDQNLEDDLLAIVNIEDKTIAEEKEDVSINPISSTESEMDQLFEPAQGENETSTPEPSTQDTPKEMAEVDLEEKEKNRYVPPRFQKKKNKLLPLPQKTETLGTKDGSEHLDAKVSLVPVPKENTTTIEYLFLTPEDLQKIVSSSSTQNPEIPETDTMENISEQQEEFSISREPMDSSTLFHMEKRTEAPSQSDQEFKSESSIPNPESKMTTTTVESITELQDEPENSTSLPSSTQPPISPDSTFLDQPGIPKEETKPPTQMEGITTLPGSTEALQTNLTHMESTSVVPQATDDSINDSKVALDSVTSGSDYTNSLNEKKCMEYQNEVRNYPTSLRNPENSHLVAIGFGEKENIDWNCVGTLVSNKFVLTTSNCLDVPESGVASFVQFNYGQNNTSDLYEVSGRVWHPQNETVGLLELREEVNFTSSIQPACLHLNGDLASLYGISWKISNSTFEKVPLKLLPHDECLDSIVQSKFEEDHLICVSTRRPEGEASTINSKDILFTYDKQRELFYVVGIPFVYNVSNRKPEVYVKIANYIPWLESVIWS